VTSFKTLYDALSGIDEEHEPFKYSGRGMYGKQCVAVKVDSDAQLWELAVALTEVEVFPGDPKTDSFGLGIVAYWPSIEWDASAVEQEEEEEEE
jgi:hypothetical protein